MNNKIIVCRLFGGLGNQLFIYAAARRFSLQYGADLYLDDVTGFGDDTVYRRKFALNNFTAIYQSASKEQRLEPYSQIRRKLARLVSVRLSPSLNGYVYNPYSDFREEYNSLPNKAKIFLEGYWQSYLYFSGFEDQLRQELKIIPPKNRENLEMAARIGSRDSTAVHLRFFDSDNTCHAELWEDYYRSGTRVVTEKCSGSHFYVFSDDPDRARLFSTRMWGENFTIVSINDAENSAFCDMWLMSQCNNIITADSTFSWWAAWFNSFPQKLVIAPRRSLSGRNDAWNVDAMIPRDWVLV